MNTIAGVDLNDLPLGQRFDELLKHLEDNSDDSGDDFSQFLGKRKLNETLNSDDDEEIEKQDEHNKLDKSEANGDDSAHENDDENNHNNNNNQSNDENAGNDCPPSPTSESSSNWLANFNTNSTLFSKTTKEDLSSEDESCEDMNYDENEEILASVYKKTGLTRPDKSSLKKEQNSKKLMTSKKKQEEAARTDLEIERNMKGEIGTHNAKTNKIAEFLNELADSSDLETPALSGSDVEDAQHDSDVDEESTPEIAAARLGLKDNLEPQVKIKVPHLASFVANFDSDDDLEIVPETKTNKMSKAIKDMLEFSGGRGRSAADQTINAERNNLYKLELKQAATRKAEKLKALEDQDIDVDTMRQSIKDIHKKQNKQGNVLSRLDREREIADEIWRMENQGNDDDANNDSDGLSEYESDGAADEADHDEASQNTRMERKTRIIPDDISSEVPEGFNSYADNFTEATELIQPTIINAEKASTVTDLEVNKTLSQDTENQFIRVGQAHHDVTTTQYVQPASQSAVADLLGLSEPETLEDEEDEDEDDDEDELKIQDETHGDGLLSDMSLYKLPENTSISQNMTELKKLHLKRQAEIEQRAHQNSTKTNPASSEPLREKQSIHKFLEDEAEESEEDNPRHGRLSDNDSDGEDDAENDQDLEELVDNQNQKLNENDWSIRAKHLQDELLNEEQMLNRVVSDVKGNFRNRGSRTLGEQFLEDEEDSNDHDKALRALITKNKRRHESVVKATKLNSTRRTSAFFASVTEGLVSSTAPRSTSRSSSSVQEGLQFLKAIAEKEQKGFDADLRSDDLPDTNGFVPELDRIQVRKHSTVSSRQRGSQSSNGSSRSNSLANLDAQKTGTITENYWGKRVSTYASRICSVESTKNSVEIINSLRSKSSMMKRSTLEPMAAGRVKARKILPDANHLQNRQLFKRNWLD